VAGALPALVSVTFWDELDFPLIWVAKLSILLDTLILPPLEPMPDKNNGGETVLPVTTSVPIRAQAAEGVNVTVTVQLLFGNTEPLQLLVCE
jgi:hypothetical protein